MTQRLESRQAARRVHLVETVQRLLRWIFTHIRTRIDKIEMCERSGVNVKVEPHLNVYTRPFIAYLCFLFTRVGTGVKITRLWTNPLLGCSLPCTSCVPDI